MRVDVGIFGVVLAGWVVGYVVALAVEVFKITDAVFVMACDPYFSRRLIPDRVGVSALDELNATSCALVDVWRDEDVYVIGHYDKCVKFETALISIAKESCDEEFGI